MPTSRHIRDRALALVRHGPVRPDAARVVAVIRIDAAWLATAPLDMRAGTDTALARVITTFGAAHPHHAYVFANQRANRLKVLVHDGVGLWLVARRLHQGKFVWAPPGSPNVALEHAQLDALVLGLPWQRVGSRGAITVI
nr:IS66 family insertion sequence element accessory protein TnpB [Hydrogenophaga aromaticivorans]